jgi:broad specificity phosphatase PhoE
MTLLAVIRHGPTAGNAAKLLMGRADEALSAEGRRMVADYRLPPELAGFEPVASPLRRARETAELLGLDAASEPALIEMDWGAWQGMTAAQLNHRFGESFAREERRGLDMSPPGGESPRQVQARLMPWLKTLSRPTLAITHRGVIRALLALATGWTMVETEPVRLARHAAHLFDIGADGRPAVERLNMNLLD